MNNLIGKYEINEFFEIGSTLELSPDSTFIYDWQVGLMNGITKGTWRLKNSRIILNSEIQPKKRNEKFIIESWLDSSTQNTTIEVTDENRNPLPNASCEVHADKIILNLTTDMKGLITCEVKPITRIEISYVGFKNVAYRLKNDTDNFLKFILQPENNSYQYFSNEKWKVRKGKIYKYRIFENEWIEKRYYEKIKINKTPAGNTW